MEYLIYVYQNNSVFLIVTQKYILFDVQGPKAVTTMSY